jgi:indole-3-glycerol phosphate synthase
VSERLPTVLARILQSTREELAQRKREVSQRELAEQAEGAIQRPATTGTGSFRRALEQAGVGVIAEFKRRSPSAGPLREGAEVAELVRAYERGGACALSVLTEGPHFDGSLADLRAARQASELPILRKDFIVDEYQLYEAWAAGADAVLLIVAALGPRELASLHERARGLGLDVLVEVHDREELETALASGAELVGINNRDLRDFSVEVGRTLQLIKHVPPEVAVVSESGIEGPERVQSLAREGVAAVLVGEALMRAPDPERALRALRAGAGAGGAASLTEGARSRL